MIKIGVESMMVESLEEIMARSEVLVIGNKSDEFMNIFSRLTPDPHVIDRNHSDPSPVLDETRHLFIQHPETSIQHQLLGEEGSERLRLTW